MRFFWFFVFFAGFSVGVGRADEGDYSLEDVLGLVSKTSPKIREARSGSDAAKESVGVARAGYFPEFNFEAVDSSGFPGSSGVVSPGGLMNSPYRSGYAYGLVLRGNLLDFGRTSAEVDAARGELGVRESEVSLADYETKIEAAKAFFECSLYRSQRDVWTEIRKESEIIAEEVARFVKTGQRSVVEKYLADAQTEEALTSEASFAERFSGSLQKIAILTRMPAGRACRVLPSSEVAITRDFPAVRSEGMNPFVERVESRLKSAAARLDRAKAGHLPRLVGTASFGEMQSSRLVAEKDYSVAIGLIVPLFDGLRTTSEVGRAGAEVVQREYEKDTVRQKMDILIAELDTSIRSSRARSDHLLRELELAQKGFAIAKQRYFSHQGTLLDIRESLRNLIRARIQINEANAEFFVSSASKAFLNGA